MISEDGFGWDLLSIINTNCGNLLVGKSLILEVAFWNIKTCCLPPTTQRTVRAQNHEDPKDSSDAGQITNHFKSRGPRALGLKPQHHQTYIICHIVIYVILLY